jgi:hypothetical protein
MNNSNQDYNILYSYTNKQGTVFHTPTYAIAVIRSMMHGTSNIKQHCFPFVNN